MDGERCGVSPPVQCDSVRWTFLSVVTEERREIATYRQADACRSPVLGEFHVLGSSRCMAPVIRVIRTSDNTLLNAIGDLGLLCGRSHSIEVSEDPSVLILPFSH